MKTQNGVMEQWSDEVMEASSAQRSLLPFLEAPSLPYSLSPHDS
jgi:hypothetical protein